MTPKTKTIDGLAVTSLSLAPTDAYDLMPELAPVLGAVIGAHDAIAAAADGNAGSIEAALRSLGQTLGGGKLTEILIRLMRATTIAQGGNTFHVTDRATFDLAFEGRMWSAVPVAAFAFEVTYGNFTDVVQRVAGVARPPAAAP